MKSAQFEKATECALQALQMAGEADDDTLRAQAYLMLSSIDIATWRDAQAWDNACDAEAAARKVSNDTLLSDALFTKGRICVYANVSGANSRDDEALQYFNEALSLAQNSPRRQVDILYNISQAWVNKNRFNDPLDKEMYRQAGEALDRAETIATEHSLADLLAKSVHYRIRYYRQGGRTDEAIDCCRKSLSICSADDYLMQSQIYNHLVILYSEKGDSKSAAQAHQDFANTTQLYMHQKSDALLQDMESRYAAAEKEYQIRQLRRTTTLLIIFSVALAGLIIIVLYFNRRVHRQKDALAVANSGKESLLGLVSRELTGPESNSLRKDAKRLAAMSDDEIRTYCSTLFEGKDNPLSNEVADYLIALQTRKRTAAKDIGLTAREMDILHCCREGLSNAAIADRLSISLSTVKNHKQNIFSKLGASSVSEMLSAADELGIG